MGLSITRMLAANDVPVSVFDTRAVDTELAVDTRRAPLTIAPTIASCVADADIVFEATTEDLQVKHAVLSEISHSSNAIIASNTSTFVPSALAQAVHHPDRFLVAHFFNPADIVPLVEVVPGPFTANAAVSDVVYALRTWGKHPVRLSRECTGFVANRLQAAILRESLSLIAEGVVTPQEIDEVVTSSIGPRWAALGPIRVADLGGLDVWKAVCDQIFPTLSNTSFSNSVLTDRAAAGHLGDKSGIGFYPHTRETTQAAMASIGRVFASLAITAEAEAHSRST